MTAITRIDQSTDSSNQYTRGMIRQQDTAATRTAYYYTDDGTDVGIKAAVDALVSDVGTTHPDNASLPLRAARGVRIFPHCVKVYLYYGYGSGSVPTATADQLTKSDSGYLTFKTWRKPTTFDATGRPAGPLNFEYATLPSKPDQKLILPPKPIYIQLPYQIVRIQTVLSSNPTPSVIGLLGSLNDADVTYAGKLCNTATVQFQRLLVDPIEEDGAVKYRVEYTMGFRKSRWVVELEPKWNGTDWAADSLGVSAGGANSWYAYIAEQQTFAGAFPVHA